MRPILDTIQRFIRATFFGFTSLLVLLSAGTVNPTPDIADILILIVVAFNFHCFGYVHNDVVDLSVDRTAPNRARDPLVSGMLSPQHALWFACAQVPVSLLLTYLSGASWRAPAVLLLGYAATVTYNVYGKRCPVPMITDAVQGVAWISIALFGALFAGGVNALSLAVAAFGFGFIFLINGVHGGLRDLRNDLAHGSMTTAIYFGARPVDRTRVRSTTGLQRFAAVPMSIMIVPMAAALQSGRLDYGPNLHASVWTAWTLVTLISLWLCREVVRSEQPDSARVRAVYGHAFFLLIAPLIVFVPVLGDALRTAVLACFFVPLLVFQDRVAEVRAVLAAWRGRLNGADRPIEIGPGDNAAG